MEVEVDVACRPFDVEGATLNNNFRVVVNALPHGSTCFFYASCHEL